MLQLTKSQLQLPDPSMLHELFFLGQINRLLHIMVYETCILTLSTSLAHGNEC